MQSGVGPKQDITTPASVTTVRTALGDKSLPAERHATGPALSRPYSYFRLVYKTHPITPLIYMKIRNSGIPRIGFPTILPAIIRNLALPTNELKKTKKTA
jgi:hypothetical protein